MLASATKVVKTDENIDLDICYIYDANFLYYHNNINVLLNDKKI